MVDKLAIEMLSALKLITHKVYNTGNDIRHTQKLKHRQEGKKEEMELAERQRGRERGNL